MKGFSRGAIVIAQSQKEKPFMNNQLPEELWFVMQAVFLPGVCVFIIFY